MPSATIGRRGRAWRPNPATRACPAPLDARDARRWSLSHEVLFDLLELLVMLSTGLEGCLDKVGLREVQIDRGWRVDIQRIERFSSPLYTDDS